MTVTPIPTPLTLPPLTFAKLAPTQFLAAHLSSSSSTTSTRPSGRSPSQPRSPRCHTGSLTHAHGSSVVRCGDTGVVCGIRGEILRREDVVDYQAPESDEEGSQGGDDDGMEDELVDEHRRKRRRKLDAFEMAHLNLLVPNLELATGCSPAHLPGGPPSAFAQTLTQRVLTLLHTSQLLRMEDLRIYSDPTSTGEEDESLDGKTRKREVKGWWVLYIEILFISLSGSAFPTAWLALLAALHSTTLPHTYHSPEQDKILSFPSPVAARRLRLYDMPVALGFGVFRDEGKGGRRWVLVDLDGFEEGICGEGGTVVVGAGGRVVRVEVAGEGGVGVEGLRELVRVAERWREEWLRVLGEGERGYDGGG